MEAAKRVNITVFSLNPVYSSVCCRFITLFKSGDWPVRLLMQIVDETPPVLVYMHLSNGGGQ